jgi:hypothetical protein
LASADLAAQPAPEPRYAEEPTAGVNLPTTGIAGESDALAVSQNPAGLHFLGGWHLALAIDVVPDEEEATAAGSGWGMFAAGTLGGKLLPRLGWGLGLEFLSPPRVVLAPDPGSPTRFTLATSLPLGRMAAVGVGWHHFFDESGAALRGLDTFDLGASVRWGAHLATGFALRDLGRLLKQANEEAAKRQALGILPPKWVFPFVIADSRNVITGAPFGRGADSPLWADFKGKLDKLDADAATKTRLLDDARAALLNDVRPAYRRTIALMEAQQKVAGTDDVDKVVKALGTVQFEGPTGLTKVRSCDNMAMYNFYVGNVKRDAKLPDGIGMGDIQAYHTESVARGCADVKKARGGG